MSVPTSVNLFPWLGASDRRLILLRIILSLYPGGSGVSACVFVVVSGAAVWWIGVLGAIVLMDGGKTSDRRVEGSRAEVVKKWSTARGKAHLGWDRTGPQRQCAADWED
jgi:hypothetical protein